MLALLWGPSFLFIKIAVLKIPPITLAALRVALAAGLLYVVLRVRDECCPSFGSVWKHVAVMGLVSNALPFTLFSWVNNISIVALAAILNGATPLFTIVLAHYLTADERITPTKFLGILLGFGGVGCLVGPGVAGRFASDHLGLLAILIAAFSLRGGDPLRPPKFTRSAPAGWSYGAVDDGDYLSGAFSPNY